MNSPLFAAFSRKVQLNCLRNLVFHYFCGKPSTFIRCVCRILKIDVIWIFVGLVFSFSFVLAARENARMRKGGYSRIYFGRKKQLVVGFNFTFPNLKCHSHQCEHKNVCSVLDFRCFHSLINRHATFCRTFCYLVYTSVYHTHTESG